MELFGYIASILMGLSLGLIGGGGSILTVPILVYMFAFEPVLATSASLFVVGSTALVGGFLALRRNEVKIKTGLLFAAPSFVGVFITKKFIVPAIPDELFSSGTLILSKPLFIMLVFALLMLVASLAMIRPKKIEGSIVGAAHPYAIIPQGFFVGMVTGLVGAGGGFLIVPALVTLIGLSMRDAIGTSLCIIAANSLFGFAVALTTNINLDWKILITVLATALVGLFIGVNFSKKIPEKTLKKSFGYFVLIMGTVILLDQLRRL